MSIKPTLSVPIIQGCRNIQGRLGLVPTTKFFNDDYPSHRATRSFGLQACRKRGAGGTRAPPLFCRSVNPISTRGAHYPHQVLRSPLDFQTLRRPWSSWIGWFRIIQPNSDLLHLVPLYAATKIEMSASTPWPIMINIAQKGIDFQFQFCLISFPEQFCY